MRLRNEPYRDRVAVRNSGLPGERQPHNVTDGRRAGEPDAGRPYS